jgi:UDPglucose 6-dehydrogenase
MIYFAGSSFAARHLKRAAMRRLLKVTDELAKADLVFVSEDTPTDEHGNRALGHIEQWLANTPTTAPLVLTSQVPPGFCRAHNIEFHMAETLRVKDAAERAYKPEQIILGSKDPNKRLPKPLRIYLKAFECPVHRVSLETAETAKIAINMALAAQVDYANRLSAYAERVGANWLHITRILQLDKRIGKYAYLDPGVWQQSRHLLRDWKTVYDSE